jgi:NAD(P)-dependent dehydrogenase (short-subunit alcohol dehydrogenase family)
MSTNVTKKLAGTVALDTGGSRGIGAAIVGRLAADWGRRGQCVCDKWRL